jgi:catechol 2,3-dioxygenase-like lactoylglutathione lyase family enzyme
MITQLKFIGIPVSDQDRALAFYTEKLGFEISTDQPMGPGQRWIELRIARSATRVVLFTPDGQEDRIGTFFNGAFATRTAIPSCCRRRNCCATTKVKFSLAKVTSLVILLPR